jgi:hypothetical protein
MISAAVGAAAGAVGRINGGDFGRRFCGYFRRFANLRF